MSRLDASVDDVGFSGTERDTIRTAMLAWYRRHRRDLPWRSVDDPYLVWVSEVMLQQTRVATVIDYYRRWLERFPTVDALAAASLEEVLEMWSGLGYYRRARYLHESATMIVDQMGSQLPRSVDGLKSLKGVGPYTAGAIASIAFDLPAGVVDGNVERVLARLRVVEGDPKSTANKKRFWGLAEALVDPAQPGDFNQAMMELGATVCTPHDPACMLCPVRQQCQAFSRGNPTAYPATARSTQQRPVSIETAVISRTGDDGQEFLIIRRPPDGLLGGLWEFPSVDVEPDADAADALDQYLADSLDAPAVADAPADAVGEVVHLLSHLRMTIGVEVRRLAHHRPRPGADQAFDRPVQWVGRDRLADVAMSAAMRKVWALCQESCKITAGPADPAAAEPA